MNKLKLLILMLTLLASVAGCAAVSGGAGPAPPTTSVYAAVVETAEAASRASAAATATPAQPTAASAPTVATTPTDLSEFDNAIAITLGETITVDGEGVAVAGSVITITEGGDYTVTGVLADGQLVVAAGDADKVEVLLNGVEIACSTSAPIYVVSAAKVILTLADGTENAVSDGGAYILAEGEDEPNAAIFSKDDLTINGNGALTVTANVDHGIASKDTLKISGGRIAVTAAGDGLRGKDEIIVKDATILVEAGGDGLQSSNATDPERGAVTIESGALQIAAGLDGIQAETALTISGGYIAIVSGGGSANSSQQAGWGNWGRPGAATSATDAPSAKGLKGGTSVTIDGGTLVIDASDDAIHSNGAITINGGEITVDSGDDGAHADAALTINEGAITVSRSYEGLESAIIAINGGTIRVAASDDGLNVAGGQDGSAMGGRPGQGMFNTASGQYLEITGGYIYVDAQGDGLDANGTIRMSGGTAIVNGPTMSGNGALDHAGFQMTGGFLVAVGSAGMAQAPDNSSTQLAMLVNLSAPQQAGTLVRIESQDGQDILTFAPTKAYQSVVLCSSDLDKGETYTVYTGGKATGSAVDGLYAGGSYSGGSQAASLTLNEIISTYGAGGMGGFGGARPGRRP